MLCEHCKKREATVKYVEVINGIKTEHNLCAQCAGHVDLGQYSALFEGEFPLGKLLSGLLGIRNADRDEEQFAHVVCPSCKTTYADFVKNSRFGCADCYSVFDPLIGENIRHLQGNERHVGKRPGSYLEKMRLEEKEREMESKASANSDTRKEPVLTSEEKRKLLKARLKDALRREDFETAAELRDAIHELEGETGRNGKMV